MLYLKIANPGVCPVEGFTVFGVSSSRGQQEKIGKFGSGSGFGVVTLLRKGINPVIFLGSKKLEFFTENRDFKGKVYSQVMCSFGGDIRELGFSAEFGESDWDKEEMALREFVSNALDGCDDPKNVEIRIVTEKEVSGNNNTTSVFVPVTPEVQRYYNEIDDRFLYFYRRKELKQTILQKRKEGPARVYRKGVYVRDVKCEWPSLYDYNFGEELKIDESRNLNDYDCMNAIAKAIRADKEKLKLVIKEAIKGEKYLETTIPYYYWGYGEDIWQEAFKELYGEHAIVTDNPALAGFVERKGFTPVVVTSEFSKALSNNGIRSADAVLSKVEAEGNKEIKPTKRAIQVRDKLWALIEELGMTNGKSKPEVICFRAVMNAGSLCLGYADFRRNLVAINVDHDGSEQTMLEELAHITSGATDLSRDFQDWILNFSVRLMNRQKK